MLKLCNKMECSYINSSVDNWQNDPILSNPFRECLMSKMLEVELINKNLKEKRGEYRLANWFECGSLRGSSASNAGRRRSMLC